MMLRDVAPWMITVVSVGVASLCILEVRRLSNANPRRKPRQRDHAEHRARSSKRKSRPRDGLIAGVELGGTTCVAAVVRSSAPMEIIDRVEVATTSPEETLSKIVAWLDEKAPFQALGVASFGPVDLDTASATYGHITTTPKPGWRNFPLLRQFTRYSAQSSCLVGFDTDVNAPAVLELAHNARGATVKSCAYITVGTGIGVGLVVNGSPVHGLMHPEGGHIMPMRHPDDEYEGWCMPHPGSVESLAAARACAERCGVPMHALASVDDDHPAWNFVAYYLAQLCLSITYIASPHVIVLSGGIMKRSSLFEKIRQHFRALDAGYVGVPAITEHLDQYIVPSAYGNNAGILGACQLGVQAQNR